MGQNKGLSFILLPFVIMPIHSPVSTGGFCLQFNKTIMADFHNSNERRYQRHSMDRGYMVDSGRIFQFPLDSGDSSGRQKPKWEMLALTVTCLWYFIGLPCWAWGLLTYVLGWIKDADLSHLTVIVGAILGLSKAIVLWAEKGDVVNSKIKKILSRHKRNQYLKKNKQERNRFK